MIDQTRNAMSTGNDRASDLKAISGESDTFKSQRLVLEMILALKQLCNHPALAALPGPRQAGRPSYHIKSSGIWKAA